MPKGKQETGSIKNGHYLLHEPRNSFGILEKEDLPIDGVMIEAKNSFAQIEVEYITFHFMKNGKPSLIKFPAGLIEKAFENYIPIAFPNAFQNNLQNLSGFQKEVQG